MLTAEGVSGRAVSVDTLNQQVTLHGKVRSADEKAKAESTVKAIEGVRGVRNLGLEFEAKLSLGRLAHALRSFSLAGNVSVIDSSVQLSADEQRTLAGVEGKRHLTGHEP